MYYFRKDFLWDFFWWFHNQKWISFHPMSRSLIFFRFFSIIRCILFLTNFNSDFKITSLSVNSIKHFMSYLGNIFFQSILLNQSEFSIFPLSSLIISLSNYDSLFLNLIDSNIWSKRFVLSKLLGGGLSTVIVKYFLFTFRKNIYIFCDFHHVSDILLNNLEEYISLDFVHWWTYLQRSFMLCIISHSESQIKQQNPFVISKYSKTEIIVVDIIISEEMRRNNSLVYLINSWWIFNEITRYFICRYLWISFGCIQYVQSR